MKKRIRKLLVVCSCAVMILSMGIVSNAASFDFYVDSAGHTPGYSGYVNKEDYTTYATAYLSTLNFNGTSGLYLEVHKGGNTASYARSVTGTGYYKPTYKSGYAQPESFYRLCGYTETACGYGAEMKGTWTP